MRYFRPNFCDITFQFVWVSKRLVKSVFMHFFFSFVPEVIVKRITIWRWWGPLCVLNKPFPNFFFKKSWTILAQCDGALSWIKMQVLLFIIRLTSGRSSFSKCFLHVLELTFKSLSFTKHKQKPLPFSTVYWCDGKGDYLEYYLYFQIHGHYYFESLKELPK